MAASLSAGRGAGDDVINADFAGNVIGHGVDIAGGHDGFQAEPMEQGNGFSGTRPGLIGNRENCH
jgi:hypothetical protein